MNRSTGCEKASRQPKPHNGEGIQKLRPSLPMHTVLDLIHRLTVLRLIETEAQFQRFVDFCHRRCIQTPDDRVNLLFYRNDTNLVEAN